MEIRNGKGEHRIKLGEKNRAAVKQFFKDNPGSTKTECSEALGLSRNTVNEHVKAILKAINGA